MVALGDGEKLLPRLRVADAQRHLGVGGGQRVAQLHPAHQRPRLPHQHCALGPDGEGHLQRTARAGALHVLHRQPALRVGLGVRREVGGQGQGVVQRLFVALDLPEGVFGESRHHGPGRQRGPSLAPRQAHRPERGKAGQNVRARIGQRPGPPQHRRLIQRTGQPLGGDGLGRHLGGEAGGKGVGHALELVGAPAAQPEQGGGRQGGGGAAVLGGLPLGGGKAHRRKGAQALAVLAQPLHVHDLMEGQLGGLAQEGGVPLGPPRTEGAEGPLRHGLALHPLQLPHLGGAGDVEDCGGGLGEGQRPLDGDELFEGGGPPHAPKGRQLLLDAPLAEGRDDLGGQLGVDAHHQPIGPPHLDAAGVDGPAVEVLGLALDAGRPRGGPEAGQLEGLGEGQLLLGLA